MDNDVWMKPEAGQRMKFVGVKLNANEDWAGINKADWKTSASART